MIDLDARPRLAAKARLRFDRLSGGYLLLYPERGLALNDTAAAVVALCSGERTIADIVDRVAGRFAATPERPVLVAHVRRLLDALAERGLVEAHP
jgi:coenzyme PQQ biosynthesis protein PqqD